MTQLVRLRIGRDMHPFDPSLEIKDVGNYDSEEDCTLQDIANILYKGCGSGVLKTLEEELYLYIDDLNPNSNIIEDSLDRICQKYIDMSYEEAYNKLLGLIEKGLFTSEDLGDVFNLGFATCKNNGKLTKEDAYDLRCRLKDEMQIPDTGKKIAIILLLARLDQIINGSDKK